MDVKPQSSIKKRKREREKPLKAFVHAKNRGPGIDQRQPADRSRNRLGEATFERGWKGRETGDDEKGKGVEEGGARGERRFAVSGNELIAVNSASSVQPPTKIPCASPSHPVKPP